MAEALLREALSWDLASLTEALPAGNFRGRLERLPAQQFGTLSSMCTILAPHIVENLRASLCKEITAVRCVSSPVPIYLTIEDQKNNFSESFAAQVESDMSENDREKVVNSFAVLRPFDGNTQEKFQTLAEVLANHRGTLAYIKSFKESPSEPKFTCKIACAGELPPFGRFILFPTSVPFVPSQREIDCLDKLVSDGKTLIVADIISGSSPLKGVEVYANEEVEAECARMPCNSSQIRAVKAVLNSLDGRQHLPKISIIHGPPGTGKSTTLAQLLLCLFRRETMTLCAAATNQAIAVLASKLLSVYEKSGGRDFRRIGLVGRAEKLGLADNAELCLIHVDSRIDRLFKAAEAATQSATCVGPYIMACICYMKTDQLTAALESVWTAESEIPERKGKKRLGQFPAFLRKSLEENLGVLLDASTVLATESPFNTDKATKFIANLAKLRELKAEICDRSDGDMIQAIEAFRLLGSEGDELVPISSLRGILSCGGIIRPLIHEAARFPPKKREFQQAITSQCLLMFSTVNSAGSFLLEGMNFEIAIIEEASQLVESSTPIVLRPSLRCLVLAGDHKQLPATVISQVSKDCGYGCSLFERLIVNDYPNTLLDVQYRMNPLISAWPNAAFYGSKLKDGSLVTAADYCHHNWRHREHFSPGIIIVNADKGCKDKEANSSTFNKYETEIVMSIVKELRRSITAGGETCLTTLGIISPYVAQVEMLKDLESCQSAGSLEVSVSTVDGVQGQEFDIVIFSAVRSNPARTVGFLKDSRRLNVAITRPRHLLIVVGDVSTLKANAAWKSFIESAGPNSLRQDHQIGFMQRTVRKNGDVKKILSGEMRYEDCPWSMTVTKDVTEVLAAHARIREDVMHSLHRLASGRWGGIILQTCRIVSPAYSAFLRLATLPGDIRYLWSVDVRRPDGKDAFQFLRVWGVLLKDKADKALKGLISKTENSLQVYTAEYRSRCEPSSTDGSLVVPRKFAFDEHFDWLTALDSRQLQPRRQEVATGSALIKHLPLTAHSVRLMLTRSDLYELPFEMSSAEQDIVESQRSFLVLGRSGTGKTTVMLHRMLHEQSVYTRLVCEIEQAQLESIEPIRQLFVTLSPVLCAAIQRSH